MTVADHEAHRCEFGSDFEAWRRTLAKSISNRLPRQHRQVEKQFGSYEHRCVRDEAGIREAFAFLRRVREGLFEEDLLDDPLYFQFYLDYALASASSGEAALYVSYIAGEPVSFLFGLVGGRHFHAVQLGTDRSRYGKYSVGNQVYYHAMQDQFNRGLGVLDMGIGDTGYKSDFRAVRTSLRNFTSAKTVRGAAVAAIYHHAKPLKNMLRRLTPRLH
jgi:CelD/BcsL family acetyltransferase involved in cellulose biosynthesis